MQLVLDRDLELAAGDAGEDVDLGEVDTGVSVEAVGVLDNDEVEPAAAPRPARRRPDLVAHLF